MRVEKVVVSVALLPDADAPDKGNWSFSYGATDYVTLKYAKVVDSVAVAAAEISERFTPEELRRLSVFAAEVADWLEINRP